MNFAKLSRKRGSEWARERFHVFISQWTPHVNYAAKRYAKVVEHFPRKIYGALWMRQTEQKNQNKHAQHIQRLGKNVLLIWSKCF